MVIEYIGTIIRNEVANRKEKLYESQVRAVVARRVFPLPLASVRVPERPPVCCPMRSGPLAAVCCGAVEAGEPAGCPMEGSEPVDVYQISPQPGQGGDR